MTHTRPSKASSRRPHETVAPTLLHTTHQVAHTIDGPRRRSPPPSCANTPKSNTVSREARGNKWMMTREKKIVAARNPRRPSPESHHRPPSQPDPVGAPRWPARPRQHSAAPTHKPRPTWPWCQQRHPSIPRWSPCRMPDVGHHDDHPSPAPRRRRTIHARTVAPGHDALNPRGTCEVEPVHQSVGTHLQESRYGPRSTHGSGGVDAHTGESIHHREASCHKKPCSMGSP